MAYGRPSPVILLCRNDRRSIAQSRRPQSLLRARSAFRRQRGRPLHRGTPHDAIRRVRPSLFEDRLAKIIVCRRLSGRRSDSEPRSVMVLIKFQLQSRSRFIRITQSRCTPTPCPCRDTVGASSHGCRVPSRPRPHRSEAGAIVRGARNRCVRTHTCVERSRRLHGTLACGLAEWHPTIARRGETETIVDSPWPPRHMELKLGSATHAKRGMEANRTA